MGYHNMPRRERHRNRLNHSHECIIVGDEDLEVITRLRQLRWGTDKVGYWFRSPIPDKDRQALVPQMISDAPANNTEADNPNRLSDGPRHISSIWKMRLNLHARNSSLHHKMGRASQLRLQRRDGAAPFLCAKVCPNLRASFCKCQQPSWMNVSALKGVKTQ